MKSSNSQFDDLFKRSVHKALYLGLGLLFISLTAFSQNQTKEYYQTKLKPNTTIGYLSYLPPAYNKSNDKLPLMIFLHGLGEIGSNLDQLLNYGPPKLIRWGNWSSELPFIVISPQTPSSFGGSWNPDLVNEVIDQVVARYRVDESRIYVTGTSLGGNGTWNYATKYPDRPAAIVPICGWGDPGKACQMKNVPTWAFHNQGDGVVSVSGTNNMVDALNKCSPNPAPKKVIYQQSGHDAWTKTYDLTAGHDIYTWMLSHKKGGVVEKPAPENKLPVVNAGPDQTLTLPQNAISLSGTASDSDGSIATFAWTKVNGPSATMSNTNNAKLSLSDLKEGTYTFRLTVTDNKGAKAQDDANVIVRPSATQPETPSNGQGVKYSYYEGGWSALPNFNSLSPKKTGSAANFDLTVRNRPDQYAIRFESHINIATAGNYTFYLTSDDGSKLYIDSKEVVNNDGLHSATEKSGSMYLTAGRHNIKVDYFEGWGDDVLMVKYSGPGISRQTIPSNQLFIEAFTNPANPPMPETDEQGLTYAYYEGGWSTLPNFSTLTPKKTGNISNFNLSPKNRVDQYAFKFEGYIEITAAGNYTFYISSDDGSKLYIDSKEVVNNDGLHSASEKSGSVYLSSGKHSIKVTYFEGWGDDILTVKYSGPGIGKQAIPNNKLFTGNNDESTAKPSTPEEKQGLNYRYYEGGWVNVPNFGGLTPKKAGTVSNFDLTVRNRPDQYAIEFEGLINITTAGNYTFYTSSDDGSKLYIDSKEVVNNDGLHSATEKSGSIYLNTGKHAIKVAYFEGWGDDILIVKYAGPGINKTTIPNNVLSINTSASTMDVARSNVEFAKAETESGLLPTFSTFPNPFVQDLLVKLERPFEGVVNVSLMDMTGKSYYNEAFILNGNNVEIKLNLEKADPLPKGVYLLQIIAGNNKEVKRIIKQ